MQELQQKLRNLSRDLTTWSNQNFGSVRREIKELKRELEKLRGDPLRSAPTHAELKINERLIELYHRKEIIWRQRARIEWLSAGDKNTIFFHLRASMRRKKNMIKALENSLGILVDDPRELKTMANNFYQNLYSSEGVQGMEGVIDHVPRKVTAAMNADLFAPYMSEEVKKALFQMFPTKAPGPDGFPAQFYQKHWEVCGEEVTNIVLRIVRGEESTDCINDTILVLIPKVTNPTLLS